MSEYIDLPQMGPGVNPIGVPSMTVPVVMKTFEAGYESLTHFIPNSNNYYTFNHAYMTKEIPTTGYYPMKRKCDGSKLYDLDTNL